MSKKKKYEPRHEADKICTATDTTKADSTIPASMQCTSHRCSFTPGHSGNHLCRNWYCSHTW